MTRNRQGTGREARAARMGDWAGLRDIKQYGFDFSANPGPLPNNRVGRRRKAALKRKWEGKNGT